MSKARRALPQGDVAEPAPARGTRARGSTAGRVRVAVYVAFAALALAAAFQGWSTWALETQRDADAALVERVGMLPAEAQQLARRAALVQALPAERGVQQSELRSLVATAAATVGLVEQVLAEPLAATAGSDTSLRAAFDRWRAAHERLRDAAQQLARVADSADDAALEGAMRQVQAAVEPAVAGARSLQQAVRAFVDRHGERMRIALGLQVALTLALLVFLAVTVVEPMLLRLRRRMAALRKRVEQLRRLALVAEHTSAIVLITDRHDRIRWVNGGFERVVGWKLEEVHHALPAELLLHPQADAEPVRRIRDAIAQGRGVRLESLHRRRDGSDLWLDLDIRPLRNAVGVLRGFIYVGTDIGQRVAEQARARLMWLALPAGVLVHSERGEIVDANRAAERILGLTREQLIGREPVDPNWRLVREDGSDCPAAEHPVARTLATGRGLHDQTVGVDLPGGERRWLLVDTEPQFEAQGQITGVIACLTDVTERRRLHERLARAGATDPLTGLASRGALVARVQRSLAHAQAHAGYGFALLSIDIDRFRQVTDTLDDGAGDELLRQVAARLTAVLRPGDVVAGAGAGVDDDGDVAARVGGDEFVVVLDGVADAERARAVAERLLADLAEPYTVRAHPVGTTVSVGIVLGGSGGAGAESLLRDADLAMVEAKRTGRGRCVLFDDSMHQRMRRAMEMEADLRRALLTGALFLAYQPMVELPGRRVTGVEALLRWRHPERGVVGPGEIVPLAEEAGLIDELGRYVLRLACAQFMRWRSEFGADAPALLAVNLSRAQLGRPGLVVEIARVLRECGMPGSALQLEVAESVVGGHAKAQDALRELKRLGVRLALDDFGAGYSSLASLHQMPVDAVKVDGAFVRSAESLEYHRVLIEATIRVARALGMSTVAEGIESEGQAAVVEQLACDQGQGWLICRPMEAAELGRWLHGQLSVEGAEQP